MSPALLPSRLRNESSVTKSSLTATHQIELYVAATGNAEQPYNRYTPFPFRSELHK